MIIDFKFKNFISFADECEFTMLANKDKSNEENLVEINNNRISKVHLICGANASGKSSLINAIKFIRAYMNKSNILNPGDLIGVDPFKFRDNYINIPSEFSITFLLNGNKYNYTFSCTRQQVLSEKLDVYYTSKATNVFERNNTNDYKFGKDSKTLNELKDRNPENKLFLITSATWNYEKTKPVVDYFLNNIVAISNIEKVWLSYMDKIVANDDFYDFKNFCIKILNNADFSIQDFDFERRRISDLNNNDETFFDLLKILAKDNEQKYNKFINSSLYSFVTFHDIIVGTEKKRYDLKLWQESIGTQQVFMLAPILYDVFKFGKAFFVDEIDKSLHPFVVKYLIKLFFNKEVNKNNAQLITNTHDTNLLDLELLRRDEIWFTEKDYKTGKSQIFPLSDFSPRKGENIEKSYLLGRFGAIPFISEY